MLEFTGSLNSCTAKHSTPSLLNYDFSLELITFEILAAERLRLMEFDNRLIGDYFANIVIYLHDIFQQIMDSEAINMNQSLGKSISRNERSQFIVEHITMTKAI